MNAHPLTRVVIRGYKSIRECDLHLRRLNVLIGANGSGKSNFLGFFELFQRMRQGQLQHHVAVKGGPDGLLHHGRKRTDRLAGELHFGDLAYTFTLEPTADDRLLIREESFLSAAGADRIVDADRFESGVLTRSGADSAAARWRSLPDWRTYHFDDMGESGRIRQRHGIHLNDHLYGDGRNLAAFLYRLQQQHPEHHRRIVEVIRQAAPFFAMFSLRPHPDNPEFIDLEWMEKGHDGVMKAHQLSDGTLRFACLVTLLMQPPEFMPPVIWIDEPELGLHPAAIGLLGELLHAASVDRQIICTTQSVDLVNEFEVEDLVVVERQEGATVFRRFQENDFQEWLSDYSLGELWLKNLLGGRP